MALTRYAAAYNGLLAIYTSPTGLTDQRTGQSEAGGGMNVGDYFDLTNQEALNYYSQTGVKLYAGRYRFVRLAAAAIAANIFQGAPTGIAKPTTVAQVVLLTAGSGQTPGTYTVYSSTSGGTQLAVAQVVVGAAGTITSTTLLTPGAGFTSTPTFTVAAGGTPGTIAAQMAISENTVTSFDASAISLTNPPRGVFLNYSIPAGQTLAALITSGAYVFIQEQGIATAMVSTATTTAVGSTAIAGTGGTVTTNVNTTYYAGSLGQTLDVAAAGALCRVELFLPLRAD